MQNRIRFITQQFDMKGARTSVTSTIKNPIKAVLKRF
jgi:hypothetical protein